MEQSLRHPFVDVCHLKPSIAITDLCFPMPSPFISWAKMLWCCHSLKSTNINVIFKWDLLYLTSGSRLHETLADLSYKAYKTYVFLPIPIVQSTSLRSSCILITEASFPLALINAYTFRCTQNAATNTSSPQCPLFALLPPAVPSHQTALSETASPDPTITHLSISGTAYWQHLQSWCIDIFPFYP